MTLMAGGAASEQAGSPSQEQAFQTLVQSLQILQADPDTLATALKRITETEAKARAEIDSLDTKIGELQKSLEEARKRQEELKSKISALKTGSELLGAKPAEVLSSGPVPPSAPAPSSEPAIQAASIDFNKQIRPILSNNCFACHGPDEKARKAKLRLDDGKGAYAKLRTGNIAIVPGDRNNSMLYCRIFSNDPDEKMPPPACGKCLTPEQIELIGQWIDQGAKWSKHWSLVKPEAPALPEVKNTAWARNNIDHFILARLEKEGLCPSEEADKEHLIRRVTFDLTGLPPAAGDVDAFLADTSPDAYEKVVDRLLASPQYGEHLTRDWLDVARYADTNGYHIDNERFMWRWRDWVIDAFNQNMPFNQFTVEQLAGDLLPNPTLAQRIATGFCRNHMITFEGGIIPEEYRVQYVVDRVNTLGTTFLGMTVNCAQCHEHKYDPITQKEYYQLFAFFNTVPENGNDARDGNAVPMIQAPLPDQEARLGELRAEVKDLEERLNQPMPEIDAQQVGWEKEALAKSERRWTVLESCGLSSSGGASLKQLEDKSILAEGTNSDQDVYEFMTQTAATGVTAIRLEALTHESLPGTGPGRSGNSNFVLTEFEAELITSTQPDKPERIQITAANADFSQNTFDIRKAFDGDACSGWAVAGYERHEDRTALFIPARAFSVGERASLRIRLRHGSEFAGHQIGRFRLSVTADPAMAPSSLGDWQYSGPFKAEDGEKAYSTAYDPEKGVDLSQTYEDGRFKWIERPEFEDGEIHRIPGDTAATYLYRTIQAPTSRKMTLSLSSNDAMKIWLNDRVVYDKNERRGVKEGDDEIEVDLQAGENRLLAKVVNYGGDYAFYFKRENEEVGEIPERIERVLALSAEKRGDEDAKSVRAYFRRNSSAEWRSLDDQRAKALQSQREFEAKIPTTMVMAEMEAPRETFILQRGQYDQPGDKVTAVLPEAFPPLPEGAPANRLGLAQWLVDPSHPLTARVTLNRFWQHYFGAGIVMTAEDFGIQGEPPSHPELLDWLATEFIRSGWDVKAMQRLMVTSATYRQSSKAAPELLEKDPGNRLLGRGARFRLDAEVIRDNALSLCGLLTQKIGGPSVKPYQPAGLWEEMAYGDGFSAQIYVQDHGEALYRRSMYTFWKRQVPPPTMLTFDGPIREVCQARRPRTNTPLQALVLLNDPQFVEASRMFARRMMKEGGADPAQRIAYGFRLATCRAPSQAELDILTKTLDKELGYFAKDPESSTKFVSVGECPLDDSLNVCEYAAYTAVASMILNLDEVVTKG